MSRLRWIDVALALVVGALALVAFSDNVDGQFCYDDHYAIVGNADVRHEPGASLAPLFWHDFWGQTISKPDSHKSYRPLTVLSFRLNYAFAGFSTRAYRSVLLRCAPRL